MKHAEKLPSRGASSSPAPPPAHRLSHAIAKPAAAPRKIRIIHVLAPHIIKTEARHFRELVQRLTGKPPQKRSCASSASTGGDAWPSPSPSPPPSVSSYDTAGDEGLGVGPGAGAGAAAGIDEVKVKEQEAETSSSSSPSGGGGGFLRALELDSHDDDGFYRGLDDLLFTSCDGMDGVADFISDRAHADAGGGFHF